MAVKLIATGGTIASVAGEGGARSRAALGGSDLLTTIGGFDVVVEDVERSPSWVLSPADMLRIGLKARDEAASGNWQGVVVTHGTSSLEYTAFLTDLLWKPGSPIVFTGSMEMASSANPDGPANLRDAITVASHPQASDLGTLVVLAGSIIPARYAWKLKRQGTDAFISTGGVPGRVGRDGPPALPAARARVAPLQGELARGVRLLKLYPGMTEDELPLIDPDLRGMVVEALPGAGGVPPSIHAWLRSLAAQVPVVIASRAPVGRVPDPPTGGTGENLADMGLLSAGDLTSEKAWLLLMAALGQSTSAVEAKDLFRAQTR